jgi:DNA-binding beta-propeller fold protein YncE
LVALLMAGLAASLGLAPAASAYAAETIASIDEVGAIDLDADAVNPSTMVLVDERYLYVANEGIGGSEESAKPSVYVVDLTTDETVERIWFEDIDSILADLYQGSDGNLYASFPDVVFLVVIDPSKPVGKKVFKEVDLNDATGVTGIYNQSMAIANDTIFVADDDSTAGVIMMPLDGKGSVSTYPLSDDAKTGIPESLYPLYEGATAQTLTVAPDGSFLYVGAHVLLAGTDGHGMFMAYAIESDKTLRLEYTLLCEIQELARAIVVAPQHIYMPSKILTTTKVEHNIYVFDNDEGTFSAPGKIEAGDPTQTAYLSPDGLLYVTHDVDTKGAFSVIDPSKGEIGEIVYRVDNPDERLVGLAFSADGTRVYASNLGDSAAQVAPRVLIYDLTTEQSEDPTLTPTPEEPTPEGAALSSLPPTGDAQGVLGLTALATLLALATLTTLLALTPRLSARASSRGRTSPLEP